MSKQRTLLLIGLLIVFIGRAQAPLADFSASPLLACVGEQISFTNNSSANGGAPLQEFVWDFGDGNTSTEEAVVHSYALPGTYTVVLVVTNASGEADPEVNGTPRGTCWRPPAASTKSTKTRSA